MGLTIFVYRLHTSWPDKDERLPVKHVAHEVLAGGCWAADKAKELVSHLNQNRPLPFFLNLIQNWQREKRRKERSLTCNRPQLAIEG